VQIKNKFKKEEKLNAEKIRAVIDSRTSKNNWLFKEEIQDNITEDDFH